MRIIFSTFLFILASFSHMQAANLANIETLRGTYTGQAAFIPDGYSTDFHLPPLHFYFISLHVFRNGTVKGTYTITAQKSEGSLDTYPIESGQFISKIKQVRFTKGRVRAECRISQPAKYLLTFRAPGSNGATTCGLNSHDYHKGPIFLKRK